MRLPSALLFLATTLVATCGDFVEPYPSAGPPAALEFSSGGFGTDWQRIRLEADSVILIAGLWSDTTWDTVVAKPSPEQWRLFWAAFEKSRVHIWREGYHRNDLVADGGFWSLMYEHDGVRHESSGANRYPRANGSSSNNITGDYLRVLGAFETLMGREVFYILRWWPR